MEEHYKNRMVYHTLPKSGTLCVCKVIDSNNTGSIVELLEYGNISGMIPATELSRKRIYNVSKILNIGKVLVGEVINVDTEKFYIDLSKKTVKEEEAQAALLLYEKRKKVHSILNRTASLLTENGTPTSRLDLYSKYAWPWEKKYGSIDSAFRLISQDNFSLPPELTCMVNVCKHAYKVKPIFVSSKVEINCFGPDGIDAIKNVLQKTKSTFDININLITSPKFLFHKTSTDVLETCALINKASQQAVEWITEYSGGGGVVKELAKARETDLQSTINQECSDSSLEEDEENDFEQ